MVATALSQNGVLRMENFLCKIRNGKDGHVARLTWFACLSLCAPCACSAFLHVSVAGKSTTHVHGSISISATRPCSVDSLDGGATDLPILGPME